MMSYPTVGEVLRAENLLLSPLTAPMYQELELALARAALQNRRVMSQLSRARRDRPSGQAPVEMLQDALASTPVGSRLLEQFPGLVWRPQALLHLEELYRELNHEETDIVIDRWAKYQIQHLASTAAVDPRVSQRKAIERSLRGAFTAGTLEELIVIGVVQNPDIDDRVHDAVAAGLLGGLLGIVRSPGSTRVCVCKTKNRGGGKAFNALWAQRFVGLPGSLYDPFQASEDPVRFLDEELPSRRVSGTELLAAAVEIAQIVAGHRKKAGSVSIIPALPGAEIERVAVDLLRAVDRPARREVLVSALYSRLPKEFQQSSVFIQPQIDRLTG